MRRLVLALLVLVIAIGVAVGALGSDARLALAAAPTVTSVSPTSGPVSGGTTVTITGTGFTGATNVIFQSSSGGAAATFTVNSDTSITATSPASPFPSPGTGTVDIIVITPGGTRPTSGSDKFTYILNPVQGNGLTFVVSVDGSDSNTRLLPISPLPPTSTFACATIQGAVDKTRDGDRIDVLDGVYDIALPSRFRTSFRFSRRRRTPAAEGSRPPRRQRHRRASALRPRLPRTTALALVEV